jgi:hypothetical protein
MLLLLQLVKRPNPVELVKTGWKWFVPCFHNRFVKQSRKLNDVSLTILYTLQQRPCMTRQPKVMDTYTHTYTHTHIHTYIHTYIQTVIHLYELPLVSLSDTHITKYKMSVSEISLYKSFSVSRNFLSIKWLWIISTLSLYIFWVENVEKLMRYLRSHNNQHETFVV